jgi:hypothetical protein
MVHMSDIQVLLLEYKTFYIANQALTFPHRFAAVFFAISALRSGVMLAVRAGQPLRIFLEMAEKLCV